nr:MAG TPA: hypothetical protein [Caudoviricetes sp.]
MSSILQSLTSHGHSFPDLLSSKIKSHSMSDRMR